MPKLTILPIEEIIDAATGATIMEAAWEHGLYWPTTCGGRGVCTSCACTVDDGAANLEPMGRSEFNTLASELGEAAVRNRGLRLACQARLRGDVTVVKRGVRAAQPD